MVNGYSPRTLDEAIEIRGSYDVIPYAGGTDLMVQNPENACYLFLNKIDELKKVTDDGEYVRIGACVTFTEAENNDLIPKIMRKAVSEIAGPAIRNAGTFGGNLGNSSDKADSVLVEFAMDAKVRLVSISGERIIPVDEFFIKRNQNSLRDDELIAEVLLPKDRCKMPYYHKKVGGRKSLAITRIAFAGLCDIQNGVIKHFSNALIGGTAVFLRFKDLEAEITGKTVEEAKAIKEEYINKYMDRFNPSRGRVTPQYRKAVYKNLLTDFFDTFIK